MKVVATAITNLTHKSVGETMGHVSKSKGA